MIGTSRRDLPGALVGGLLLAAATPPAWFPGAEWLVLAGLGAWFAIARTAARPWLASYVFGCVHMAWFSWSVRHVLWPAYAAIVLVGGLYFVLGTAALRAAPRRLAAPAFGVAVAATFWLRSVMPEIHYPHGQPVHCLWQWPGLLGPVHLGGEPLANALLGLLAAAGIEAWWSWRTAALPWRRAVLQLAGAFAAAVSCAILGRDPGPTPGGTASTVSIAAIEPGLHPMDPYEGLPLEAQRARYEELFEQRLIAPTRALLAAPRPPDLILWPESSVPSLSLAAIERRERLPVMELGPSAARLLVGGGVRRPAAHGADRETPAAVLLSGDGRVLGHQEKRCLVPGGEFLPFVHWLPDAVRAVVHEAFRSALGSPPDSEPGRMLPPLSTAAGAKFGALLCYDNAFPGPAAEQVAAGATFLCVLSNEAWYRGGGELQQLVAQTVCRAVELRTPIVRCTTDGWSVAVDAAGRIVAAAPLAPAPTAASALLRAELTIDPARQTPMAWTAAGSGPAAAVLLCLALLRGLWGWFRRPSPRSPSGGPVGRPATPAMQRTGS